MRMYADLTIWAENGKGWEDSISLYEKLVGKDTALALAIQCKSSFTENAILSKLEDLHATAQADRAAVEVFRNENSKVSSHSTNHNITLPQSLAQAYAQKSELYKSIVANRSTIKKILAAEFGVKFKGPQLTIKQALDIMKQINKNDDPIPFSIKYMTANLSAATGGELIYYEKAALLSRYTHGNSYKDRRSNHKHWINSTRNIRPVGTTDTRKLHIWLILELNGQEVILNEQG